MEEIVLFSVSVLVSAAILYVLGLLWFGDTRNRQLKNLFALGSIVSFWILINAISTMVAPRYYPFVYTLRMIAVCLIPYALFWFFLYFSKSRLVDYKALHFVLTALPLLDVAALVTNPWHRLYFSA